MWEKRIETKQIVLSVVLLVSFTDTLLSTFHT